MRHAEKEREAALLFLFCHPSQHWNRKITKNQKKRAKKSRREQRHSRHSEVPLTGTSLSHSMVAKNHSDSVGTYQKRSGCETRPHPRLVGQGGNVIEEGTGKESSSKI